VDVAVELVGVPVGVRTENGILDHIAREVEIECLPGDIPAHLSVDVSGLHVGQHIEASALEIPEGIILHTEEDRVIASVVAQRILEEETEEDEEGLLSAAAAEPKLVGEDEEEDD
jgi:large subunit ribosomal protein L25